MSLLQVANLTKSYHMSDELSIDVLKGIDAHFNKGEMIALLGESGCGKSTLLNILGGLDSEFGGSVIYNGEFLTDFTPSQMDDYRKSKVGIVFQGFNLISHLSVLENVILPMKMANWTSLERKAHAKKLLGMVGLKHHLNKLPNQLSGGQRQRVAIARALANDPDIILADEPTGNLDKESAGQIIDILQEISQNDKLVIVVTHSEAVASNCTRIITMDDGKFVSTKNNVEQIQKKADLKRKAAFQKKQADNNQDDEEIAIDKDEISVSRSAQPMAKSELFKFAATNLWHQRSRSVIVSLGTSVGIIALILMMALSLGLKGYINERVMGSINLLQINVQKNASNGGVSGDKNYFLQSDIDWLKSIDYVERVETSTTINLGSTYAYNTGTKELTGDILTLTSAHTSYVPDLIEPEELDSNLQSGQILITKSLANKLLESVSSAASVDYSMLLGKSITIKVGQNSRALSIVGVINSDETLNNFASCVISASAMQTLAPDTSITNAYVFAEGAEYLDTIMEYLDISLYSAYRVDTTIEDMLYYINLGTGILLAICAISLIVSAIMIYIVMNISITERTKEIGILRAIGARKKDVRNIFIYESGLLGAAAGAIAIIICALIAATVNIVMSVEMGSAIISANPLIYLGGLLISVCVSLFSGLIPANQASDADPVDSLRSE